MMKNKIKIKKIIDRIDMSMNDISATFINMCPNCGGEISSERMWEGLPCETCLPEKVIVPKGESFEEKFERLKIIVERSRSGELINVFNLEKKVFDFKLFFEKTVGSPPWGLQINWARRVLSKQSFVALAPTGVGKTTFGMVMSLFIPGKSFIIIPTKILLGLVKERIEKFMENAGIKKKILAITKPVKEISEEIKGSEYDILISTSMFLARNLEIIPHIFDFIFIDDVDSYLKQPRNVERTLRIMGLSTEDVLEVRNSIIGRAKLMKEAIKGDKEAKLEIGNLEGKVKEIRKKIKGVLVLSSATAKPRGITTKYFREIFGFDITQQTLSIRNTVDVFTNEGPIEIVKRLGKGGLIFLNSEMGREKVQVFVEKLQKEGINAISYENFTKKNQEKFRKGEIDVVVGISSLRNPLTRGIDMPETIRYALFVGVPRFVFRIKEIELEPPKLLSILLTIKSVVEEKKIISYIESLKKYLSMKAEDIQKYDGVKKRLEEIKKFIEDEISKNIEKIKNSDDIPLRVDENGLSILVADVSAYIQASGRTSRLYVGGMTKGLSVIIVDEEKIFKQLKKRIKFEMIDIEFKRIEEVKIEDILKEIDEDRRKVMEIKESERSEKFNPKNVSFIVESPTKAYTIARLIGRPTRRRIILNGTYIDAWEVSKGDMNITLLASGGHILDLPFSYDSERGKWWVEVKGEKFVPIYKAIKRCRDCGENFFEGEICQYCQSKNIEDKENMVLAIRKIAEESDEVFIMTDPDYEGEKIAWDIYLTIKHISQKIWRAEYHEVTRKAIKKAIENPREVDENLVKAQILRRITDRWVGFHLSKVLQREKDKFWLSAGRVQTPILGWLLEREEKRKEKIGILKFIFNGQKKMEESIRITLDKAKEIKKAIRKKRDDLNPLLKIKIKEEFEDNISPQPPYTTADMLKDAGRYLKFSAVETMKLSQALFEAGIITYHRTSSTHTSDVGIGIAKDILSDMNVENLFYPRKWGEEGAHECIRPTKPISPTELMVSVSMGNILIPKKTVELYKLIFERFVASQMKPVKVLKAKVILEFSILNYTFEKEDEIILKILEDGWNKIKFFPIPYISSFREETKPDDVSVEITSPLPPYTEAELIDEMKRKGIGKPSTWATTIKTLYERGYVIERKGYIFITKLGKEVYEFLSKNEKYSEYTKEEYTKYLEEKMEKVEKGEEDYQKILMELFKRL